MSGNALAQVSPDFRESFRKSAPCAPEKSFVSKFTSRMVLDRLSRNLDKKKQGNMFFRPNCRELDDAKRTLARQASYEIISYVAKLELSEEQRKLLLCLRYDVQNKLSASLLVFPDPKVKSITVQQGMVLVPYKIARGKEKLFRDDHPDSLFSDVELSPNLGKSSTIGGVAIGIGTFAYLALSYWENITPMGVFFTGVASFFAGVLGSFVAGGAYCAWALARDAIHAIKDPPAMMRALDTAIKNILWPPAP